MPRDLWFLDNSPTIFGSRESKMGSPSDFGKSYVAQMTRLTLAAAALTGLFFTTCMEQEAQASGASEKSRVDLYVLGTTVTAGQPCTRPTPTDIQAVRVMIAGQLGDYRIVMGSKPGPDYLSRSNYPLGSGSRVAIASVCRTGEVYAISVNGYWLGYKSSGGDQTSGSISGTFDSLESSDWSNVFGGAPIFPFAAFLPVPNDTNGFVNARLVRNLPITLIATPAPAPIAPSPSGQPPPPLPPPTRMKECQASAYQMLIVGRALVTSTSDDLSRVIVAGSALQFHEPTWGGWYQGGGAALGLLFNPASADVSVDFFICPTKSITVRDGKGKAVRQYMAGSLYEVGGEDAHITGHQTTPMLGIDPYASQIAIDHAVVDLANQLDCVIYSELAELQIPNYKDKQKLIYGDNDLGQSTWCQTYFATLKFFEGDFPKPVSAPTQSAF